MIIPDSRFLDLYLSDLPAPGARQVVVKIYRDLLPVNHNDLKITAAAKSHTTLFRY